MTSDTLRAIIAFQHWRGIAESGLIEPGDNTFYALVRFSGPRHMQASPQLIDWLKRPPIEDFKPRPYNDSAKPPNATIGYGHKIHSGPVTSSDVERFRNGITPSEAGKDTSR